MTAYQVDVTCPRCGGDVDHVTANRPHPTLTLTARTVCRCPDCRVEWLLVLELSEADRRVPTPGEHFDRAPAGQRAPCGTEKGYHAHLRRSEPTCVQCREAHRIHVAARTPAGKRRRRTPRKVSA
jgi:hypothetical protein